MNKSELVRWLQQQNQQWETLLYAIGPERMTQPGVNGDWSMKDIVAHLTGWNRWLVMRLQAAARGEPEPTPPWSANLQAEDDINVWIYESNRERPLDQVLEEMRQDFLELITVIESLPDDVRIEHIEPAFYPVWVNGERFPAGDFFDHFRDDHLPDIHAWLARQEKP